MRQTSGGGPLLFVHRNIITDVADQSDATFGITGVLATLFRDLTNAEKTVSSGYTNPLAISGATVELAFTVSSNRQTGGGLSIGVVGVNLGGIHKRESSAETVHRITLELRPVEGRFLLDWRGELSGGSRLYAHKPTAKKAAASKRPAKKTAAKKRVTARRAPARGATRR